MGKKPRLIIGVLMHDAGRQFGCYGAPNATPHIDALASGGVLFENHFSTGTVCIPSRASVLIGKYLHNAETCFYNHNVATLPRLLSKAGYQTHRCGFAEEKEYHSIAGGPYPYGDRDVSGTRLLGYDFSHTETAAASGVVDTVIKVISENPGKPLYVAAAFSEAHSPYNLPVSDEDIDNAAFPARLPQLPDVRAAHEMLARFNKAVSNADEAIGRLTDYITESGLFDDTLLYFSADHGIDFPRAKQSCYDSGTGVPLIFWGGALPGSRGIRVSGLSSHTDIMPTLCELAGAPCPDDISGVSQLPQLEGREGPRRYCFSEVSLDNTSAPVRAVRTDRYRYIINFIPGIPVATGNSFTRLVGPEILTPIYNTPRPREELYDIENDPAELCNLADKPEYRRLKAELKTVLFRELASTGDELLCVNEKYKTAYADGAISMWHKKEDGSFELIV